MNFVEMLSGTGPLITVHLYALSVVAVISAFLAGKEKIKTLACAVLCLTFIVQGIVLIGQFIPTNFADASMGFYLSLLSWGVLFVGLVAWIRRGLAVLSLAIAPVSLLLCLVGLLQKSPSEVPAIPPNFSPMFSVLHIGAFFLAFGLITLAFGAACLFLFQERGIKSKMKPSAFHNQLPSLTKLDKINAVTTWIGFPLFSIGTILGLIGAHVAWGSLFNSDPKEIVSLLCWGLYAWLFHQRLAKGWRGHKPALMMIALFLLCVFSLIGVNVFMDTHHRF